MAAGLYVCINWAPRLIRNEPRRITLLYREDAEQLKAEPAAAVRIIRKRPVGAAVGKIDGVPWGRYVTDGTNYVWVQTYAVDGKRAWRVAACKTHEQLSWGWIVYGGSGGLACVVLVLTVVAVWNFIRFMKERDDFLAATAHDLTTPLIGLRMTIGKNDEDAKALVERMIRLVGNIKDFLRLGGRRRPPEVTEFDILTACRAAYALFAADYRDLFDGEDVLIEATEPEMTVKADETMTVQVLWNLLGNDLKYAAPYGKVAVKAVREGAFVKISFEDEGQGMTPRQMRRAFDRYYRAKTVLQTGKGGFGIGLCTAKEFAEAMGGKLTVVANRPKGCIFSLYLPSAI